MHPSDDPRARYAAGTLQTASPPKIVTMCFDRLDRDLAAALVAIDGQDHFECNAALGHAQDLLGEMAGMLDLDAWEHARSLVALYDYLLRLLAAANTFKNAGAVREAQVIVRELGDAFRAAAGRPGVGSGDASAPDSVDVSDPGERPRLSIRA